MAWYVTGGSFSKNLNKFDDVKLSSVVILGDACFFNKGNEKMLKKLSETPNTFYCVRGGLENDPEFTEGLIAVYNEDVEGLTFFNTDYPNIKYLEDGQIYMMNGKRALVIGGGLPINERDLLLKGKGYYPNTSLTQEEMERIKEKITGKEVDIVLSYTAPLSWEMSPNEDKSMELWLGKLKTVFTWKKWMFGKYKKDISLNDDILEFYNDIFTL